MVWSRKGTHWLKGGRITEGKEKLVNPSNLCLGCSSSTKSHDLPLHLIWVLVHGLLPSDCPPHLTSPSFDHTPSPYSALFFFKSVHKCLKHGLITTVCICFLTISLNLWEAKFLHLEPIKYSGPRILSIQYQRKELGSLEMLSSDRGGRVRRTKHMKKKAKGAAAGSLKWWSL